MAHDMSGDAVAVLEHGERFTQRQLVEIAESGRWKAALNRRRYLVG